MGAEPSPAAVSACVKGQDERQKTAPLTTLHATREVTAMSEKKIRRAATSGLTFMTFS
jgi:hypothetical protein